MRLSVALLLCLACLAAPLRADPPAVAAAGALPTVSLIDGWRQPDGGRVAGIVITLEPGWHTYWRVPGEAGIPPSFDWSASRNVAAVRYEWPRPDILDSYGMRSYGYVDALVLPVLLTPKDPAAPMDVALSLSFGICKDVCMQADRAVAARLGPEVGPGAADGRRQIEAALAERAHSAAEAGIARVTCGVATRRGRLRDHGGGDLRPRAGDGAGGGARERPAGPVDRRGRERDRGPHRRRPGAAGRRRQRRAGAGAAGAAADDARRPPGGRHPRLRLAGVMARPGAAGPLSEGMEIAPLRTRAQGVNSL